MISLLIPSYGRSDRWQAVSDNIHANTTLTHRVWFIVEPEEADKPVPDGDRLCVNERKANYAGAINTACLRDEIPRTDTVFLGADDLNFHPGWDVAGMRLIEQGYKVVGTNDLGNPYVLAGQHSTHSFVAMDYIRDMGGVIDEEPGVCLPEIYDHNYTDTEFVATAKMRGVFSPCLESVAEHCHYAFGKATMDATYDRGNRESDADRVIYLERKARLWNQDHSQDDVL